MKYVYINNYVRDDDLTRPVQKRESEVSSTARALKYLNYMFGIRRNMKVKLFFYLYRYPKYVKVIWNRISILEASRLFTCYEFVS